LIKTFAKQSQFVVVTHNRVTMEVADVLYGITMDEGGGSKVLSLKMV
jgi:chromosome segregation protein